MAHETKCAACQTHYVSAYSLRAQDAAGEGGICFRCWSQGTRSSSGVKPVQSHARLIDRRFATPTRRVSTTKRVVCERCVTSVPVASNGRSEPIYCPACQEALVTLPDLLPEGAVTFNDAAYLESVFHRFLLDRIQSLQEWPGDKKLRRGRVTEHHLANLDTASNESLSKHPLKRALEARKAQLPQTSVHQIQIQYRRFRWWPYSSGKTVTLCTASVADQGDLLNTGFVVKPAGAGQLRRVMECRDATGATDSLLVVFSPTGWEAALVGPAETRLVTPAKDGHWDIRTNVADGSTLALVNALFDRVTDTQRIEQCRELLSELPLQRYPLSAVKWGQQHGISPHAVAQIFWNMAENYPSLHVSHDRERDDWLLDVL